MNKILLLIVILLLAVLLPFLFHNYSISQLFPYYKENYVNLSLGKYPNTQNEVLLQNSYPITGMNGVSNKQSSDIWWYKYIPPNIGSYEQITNNLKYRNNPDEGNCSGSEFCGALYKDYQKETNINTTLPPVKQTCGARINYYNTPQNFLTYRNRTSILY
jgi:uncharacterized protein YxeA